MAAADVEGGPVPPQHRARSVGEALREHTLCIRGIEYLPVYYGGYDPNAARNIIALPIEPDVKPLYDTSVFSEEELAEVRAAMANVWPGDRQEADDTHLQQCAVEGRHSLRPCHAQSGQLWPASLL